MVSACIHTLNSQTAKKKVLAFHCGKYCLSTDREKIPAMCVLCCGGDLATVRKGFRPAATKKLRVPTAYLYRVWSEAQNIFCLIADS